MPIKTIAVGAEPNGCGIFIPIYDIIGIFRRLSSPPYAQIHRGNTTIVDIKQGDCPEQTVQENNQKYRPVFTAADALNRKREKFG